MTLIKSACSGSFVFVQLVERTIFNQVMPNWPFEEYQEFKQASATLISQFRPGNDHLNRRLGALIAAKDKTWARPLNFPLEYETWGDEVLDDRRCEILP
ncbi:MAG: hypothetical protein ACE5Q6_21355, partial [Dehalococcoidia bacterium]